MERRQFLKTGIGLTLATAGYCRAADSGRADVPWLAEVQRPPTPLPAGGPSLGPLLKTEAGDPINTMAAWKLRRAELQRWWLDFLGDIELKRQPKLAFNVLKEERIEGILRQLIEYEVEPSVLTQAYLLRPTNKTGPLPGAVVLHSTVNHSIRQPAGLADDKEKAFGWELARRGFVAICPRNFLWPDNERIVAQEETARFQKRRPLATGMAKMLWDAQVATDLLVGDSLVDPQRICAVGHSLGAKEVLYLAAFDERIQATVSSEGGIGTKFSNWEAPWYLGPKIQQPTFTHEHHELLALIAPRPFLLIGGESADNDKGWPFIEAALPVYKLYGSPSRLGFYNHRQGHAVPPAAEKKIYEWLECYT